MDSREQFEEFFTSEFGGNPTTPEEAVFKDSLALAWKASRAALVVDIDSHTEFEIEHMISPQKEGYPVGWIDGRNYAAKQARKAGISIKGD